MPATRPPVAHRYCRFSSKPQEKGHSVKRQTDLSARWSERNAIPLDSRPYFSYGKSAYSGEHLNNDDLNGLAAFLAEAARTDGLGRVQRGDYLVIENLDRLSREHIRKAHGLFNSILDAGINIVTTSPEYVYRHDSTEITDTLIAVMELSRANRESEQKSTRLKASWSDRREKRLGAGLTLTRRVPAWVTVTPAGDRVLNEPVAASIRQLFIMAADGHGVYAIAGMLNQLGSVSPSGRPWSESTVYHYLTSRAATGELAPKLGRKKTGVRVRPPAVDPLPDYYPRLVEPDLFERVQRQIGSRARLDKDGAKRPHSGHRGRAAATNLFAGRVFVWDTSHTYVVRPGGHGRKRLDPLGLKTAVSISYHHFEHVVLRHLRELTPSDVLPVAGVTAVSEVHSIRDQLDVIRAKIVEFTEAVRARPKSAMASVLMTLEDEKERLENEHALAVAKADAFRPEVLSECQSLVGLLATDADIRPKVRSAIARLVERIDLRAVRKAHGRAWFCARVRLTTGAERLMIGEYSGSRLLVDVDIEDTDKGPVVRRPHRTPGAAVDFAEYLQVFPLSAVPFPFPPPGSKITVDVNA